MRRTYVVLAALALGCGGLAGGTDGDTATDTAIDTDTAASMGSCPAPDPTLAPVPEGQAASTQAAYACMAAVGCLCDEREAESVPSCRHSLNMRFEEVQAQAQAMGLHYDGVCLAQHVADLAEIGCAVDPDPTHDGAPWSVVGPGRCGVYHGDVAEGGACTAIAGGISDCAQGLACWDGSCVDPCAAAATGERCQGVFGFACPPGTVCPYDACVVPDPARAGPGDDCTSTTCVAGTWCAQLGCDFEVCTYQCVAQGGEGTACADDRECASGFCGDATCTTGPLTGEACVGGRCFAGRECIAGTCGDPEGAICPSL